MSKLNNFERSRKNYKNRAIFQILLLLIIAIFLTVLPVSEILRMMWPHWLLLLVIYAVVTRPANYGIFFGFILGLMVDLLLSNKVGVHAMSYSIICYFLLKVQHKIYLFPLFQHGILAFFLVLFDSAILVIFSNAQFNLIFIEHCIFAAFSTSIIWAFLVKSLKLRQELSKIR